MTATTLLNFVSGGLDAIEYATRGLTQTLVPIEASSSARRTVNGTLIDISASQFCNKYRSTINCPDQMPPAIDGVCPGDTIVVDCVSELSYKTDGGSPAKTVVAGSSRVCGAFTFYRPQITFLITTFQVQTDEWGAIVNWTLELEEV